MENYIAYVRTSTGRQVLGLEEQQLRINQFIQSTGDNLIEILSLNNIYFDLGKYTLRPKSIIELDQVVAFLNKYNSVKIEVGSHTDSRQTHKYNEALSDRRAKSTVQYILSKGIAVGRITGKGLGESEPKVDCKEACTEEEYAQNRRSEFLIVK